MDKYEPVQMREIISSQSNRALLKDYRLTVATLADIEQMITQGGAYYLGDRILQRKLFETRFLSDVKTELVKRGYTIEKIKL